MTIVDQYKSDLKELRRKKLMEDNFEKETKRKSSDKPILSSMITSTEYSLFWLQNGHERPIVDNSPTKLSKAKREQIWGNVEHAKSIEQGVWDTYSWEETEDDRLTDEQLERKIDVDSIMSKFSNQELNVFLLKNQSLYEVSEIAEELKLTEKAVYKTLERINIKIEGFFNSKYNQLALFA